MGHHLKLAVPLAILAVSAVAAITGCAQQGVQPGAGASSSAPALSAPSAPPSTTPSTGATDSAGSPICKTQLTIVASDGGKTLCVSVGGTVTVDLDPGSTSAVEPFDVSGDSLKQGAADGTFAAVKPGATVITTERRNCPKPSPGSGMVSCNSIQLWKVTVDVK